MLWRASRWHWRLNNQPKNSLSDTIYKKAGVRAVAKIGAIGTSSLHIYGRENGVEQSQRAPLTLEQLV